MEDTHPFWLKSLLLLLIALTLTTFAIHPVAAATITVDDSGGEDHTTIQAAIDNATPGDTIKVYPGTYNENVDVNKQVNITSTGGAAVTNVIAALYSDHVFEVTADNVAISGFNVGGAAAYPNAGIYLGSSSNGILINNTASNNTYYGI
ncbi:MAG: hypothetical protein U9N13_08015 [Euryarchaeota archaeon]|nr:hypothetical protein [Euryarchaeota archaeon]